MVVEVKLLFLGMSACFAREVSCWSTEVLQGRGFTRDVAVMRVLEDQKYVLCTLQGKATQALSMRQALASLAVRKMKKSQGYHEVKIIIAW